MGNEVWGYFVRRAGPGRGRGPLARTGDGRCLRRPARLRARVEPRRKRETETGRGRRSKKPSWGVRWGPLRQIWVEEEEWAAGAVISEARW